MRVVLLCLFLVDCTHVKIDPVLPMDRPFMECAAYNPDTHTLIVTTIQACQEAIKNAVERRESERMKALLEGRNPDAR